MGASRDFSSSSTNRIVVSSSSAITNVFNVGGTLACWALTGGLVNADRFMQKGTGTLQDPGWRFTITTGNVLSLGVRWSGNARWDSVGTLSNNTWNFVSVTYNSTSTANDPSFYINGILQTTVEVIAPSGSVTSDFGVNLTIGNDSTFSRGWNGNLCYVQMWRRTLSVAEINEAMIRPGSIRTNLVGYWPCLGSDSPERDLSGNGNSGTVTGATESFNGPPVRLF